MKGTQELNTARQALYNRRWKQKNRDKVNAQMSRYRRKLQGRLNLKDPNFFEKIRGSIPPILENRKLCSNARTMQLSNFDILLNDCCVTPPPVVDSVCSSVCAIDGGVGGSGVDGVGVDDGGVMVRVGSSPTEPIQPRPSIVSGDRVGDRVGISDRLLSFENQWNQG